CVTCLFPCVTFGRVGEIVDEGTNCKYKNYNVINYYYTNLVAELFL
ncbi:hypothetical protein G4B88_018884, partial [Cannabis sativa]